LRLTCSTLIRTAHRAAPNRTFAFIPHILVGGKAAL
jgi:hypothetical protein